MRHHPWSPGAILGGLAGLLVAAAVMYVAWQHDPQGEIHDESGVHLAYWLLLGFSWFAPVAVAGGLVSGALLTAVSRLRGKVAAG